MERIASATHEFIVDRINELEAERNEARKLAETWRNAAVGNCGHLNWATPTKLPWEVDDELG